MSADAILIAIKTEQASNATRLMIMVNAKIVLKVCSRALADSAVVSMLLYQFKTHAVDLLAGKQLV